MRDLFEARFAQIIAMGKVQVLASQATSTQQRPAYPSKKSETLFRWIGKGRDVAGGELRFASLQIGKGAPFDLERMTTPESASYAVDYPLRGALRWFDDHPDSGDGEGLVATTKQLLAYDNGNLYPSALTVAEYLTLQLATPGLFRAVLYAEPQLSSFRDENGAKHFLVQRKDLAKSTAKLAVKLFGEADLTVTERFLAGVAAEKYVTYKAEDRVQLRAK